MKNKFFEGMLDLSFRKFVTLKVLGVVYVIGMIFIAIITAVFLIGILSSSGYSSYRTIPSGITGVKSLDALLTLTGAFLYWIGLRVSLEFFASVLRIADNTGRMAEMMEEDEPLDPDRPDVHY